MILYRQANGKGNVNSLVQIANGVCCPDSGDVCQFTASVTKATVGAITAFSVKDKDGVTVKTTVSMRRNCSPPQGRYNPPRNRCRCRACARRWAGWNISVETN